MKYDGKWKNGKRHGKGVLTYPDGSIYKGDWRNNRMHGYGIKIYNDSKIYKYSGEWRNGNKNGKGVQYFSPKEWYEGEWKDGKMHGQGSYTSAKGIRIRGEWKNGMKCGPGIEIYPDGKIFKGQWKNQKKNGRGIIIYPDGTRVEGEWIDGRLAGSSDFYMMEFEGAYDLIDLCLTIKSDLNVPLSSSNNSIKWLNELIEVPDLYERYQKKIQNKKFDTEINMLTADTEDFRGRKFSELTDDQKRDIKRLNRLLIEHLYPEKTPKIPW